MYKCQNVIDYIGTLFNTDHAGRNKHCWHSNNKGNKGKIMLMLNQLGLSTD